MRCGKSKLQGFCVPKEEVQSAADYFYCILGVVVFTLFPIFTGACQFPFALLRRQIFPVFAEQTRRNKRRLRTHFFAFPIRKISPNWRHNGTKHSFAEYYDKHNIIKTRYNCQKMPLSGVSAFLAGTEFAVKMAMQSKRAAGVRRGKDNAVRRGTAQKRSYVPSRGAVAGLA